MTVLLAALLLNIIKAQKFKAIKFFINRIEFSLWKSIFWFKMALIEKKPPHILFSQTTLSGLFTESKTFSASGVFQVTSCLFIECQSMTKKGGALLIDLSSGSLSIQHTAFYNCISGLQGGGLFYNGQTAKVTETCFFKCQAATHDACYFKVTALFSLQSDVSIYASAPSDKIQNGPNLEITGDSSTIKVLNMTANNADQKSNAGVLQLTTSASSTVSHCEFLTNSANYIVYTSTKLAVNFCNFVENIFSTAVFGVEKNKVNLANDIIIGPDPKSSTLLSKPMTSHSNSNYFPQTQKIINEFISLNLFQFLQEKNEEKRLKLRPTNYISQNQKKFLFSKINHEMDLKNMKPNNNNDLIETKKKKPQLAINMNTRDVVAVLLTREATFSTFGCMISYRRINSSVVAGPVGQFERRNVITVAIPTFGNEECQVMINAAASKGYTGIAFPVSVNNIAALTVVGIIVIIVMFFIVWLECKKVLHKKVELSNENVSLT